MGWPNRGWTHDKLRRQEQRSLWVAKQLNQGMCRDCRRPRKLTKDGRVGVLCAWHAERRTALRRLRAQQKKEQGGIL